jgi:RNA polymerase sigma factor (sigma-70 family)
MMRTRERIVDEWLVLAVQARRVDAFERLAARWQPRLLRHAWRLTGDAEGARDAVQDAWLAIARGIGRLRDPAAFGAWALRITSRRCADWVARRQGHRRRFADLDAAEAVAAAADPPDDDLARVRDAIRRLGPDERALLAMYYTEGFGVAEIAAALDIPAGTVKSRLYHARERLRAIVEV